MKATKLEILIALRDLLTASVQIGTTMDPSGERWKRFKSAQVYAASLVGECCAVRKDLRVQGPRPTPEDDALCIEAIKSGCSPIWYDGLLGWRYHCNCSDHLHCGDQQCSALTSESVKMVRA